MGLVSNIYASTDKPRARGRKDKEKQEAVIRVDVVRERIEELVGLHRAAKDAAQALNDAITATVEKAGLHAANVRKFVAARASGEFTDKAENVAQLALIFDWVGG